MTTLQEGKMPKTKTTKPAPVDDANALVETGLRIMLTEAEVLPIIRVSASTLKRMVALAARYQPERIIALGDSFHDRGGAERLDEFERATLRALTGQVEWIWIEGNHDPVPPAWLGGTIASQVAIGGLLFRHEPSAGEVPGEVAGHLHPCLSVTRRGRTLRRRCFVSDGGRMVLPAFGAYAGGLDVREPPLASLFTRDVLAYLLGARRVYAIAA